VVDGHVGQGAERAVDAAHDLVHHGAQPLVLGDVCAAGDSDLGVDEKIEGQSVVSRGAGVAER
jgi:hypothetical protein